MKKDHAALLKTAREQLDDAESADKRNRESSKDDLRFAIGEQWDPEIKRAREAEGKPCLVINAMPQFIRQVTGQIRQIDPAIRVLPADSAATKDVAEIYEGLIRHIQYQSDAASVFEASAESAAACGIGHFRVRADYCAGASFDQELLIERIHNPFAVLWDPNAKDPTRKDAGWCFVLEDMPKADFEAQYPDHSLNEVTDEHKDGSFGRWVGNDTVTVAEYYWIEPEEIRIGLMPDGSVMENPPAFAMPLKTRTATINRVKWAKITGTDVLEGPIDVPGPWIPVFAVTGEEWHLGDEMYRSGVIRFAKDPQRLYNYSRSASAELTAIQPKAPYLVTPRQVAGFEEHWKSANTANAPYLPYNPDPNAPPPQRVPPPVPSAALAHEIGLASEDMKRTTGIYDASLGARSNETSGIAIAQRKQEGHIATSVYVDNMVKAIRHCGAVMVAQIPAIYDTQRVVRVLGEDDQEKIVAINQTFQTIQGQFVQNDLTVGKYDIRVSAGPSYDSKRQEASAGMMDFIRAYPPAAQAIADLIAKMQDWPDADRVAERLKKTMPPHLLDAEDMPPEMVQQIEQQAQQQAQMQQLAAQLEAAKAEAEVRKENADANKVELEVAEKQFELAIASGQMDAAINAAVARVLQGIMAQQAPQPMGAMPY